MIVFGVLTSLRNAGKKRVNSRPGGVLVKDDVIQ